MTKQPQQQRDALSSSPINEADREALDITESLDITDAASGAADGDGAAGGVTVELGETYEIVVEGTRIEAFLTDNVFVLDPASPEVRTALRGYAYGLASRGKTEEARGIMRALGRQG